MSHLGAFWFFQHVRPLVRRPVSPASNLTFFVKVGYFKCNCQIKVLTLILRYIELSKWWCELGIRILWTYSYSLIVTSLKKTWSKTITWHGKFHKFNLPVIIVYEPLLVDLFSIYVRCQLLLKNVYLISEYKLCVPSVIFWYVVL